MNLRSFFLGFILALTPFLLISCVGPKITYLLYSVDRKDFEGVNANGDALIIPGNSLQADKLICTDANGWSIQQNWMNNNCR